MKRCNKCLQTKEYSEFHRSKRFKDGYKSTCKECRKVETRGYTIKYRDEIAKRRRFNRELNRDVINKKKREYYWAHRDKLKEQNNAWYRHNKDRKRLYDMKYRVINKERIQRKKLEDYHTKTEVKLRVIIRGFLTRATNVIKQHGVKTKKAFDYLGCDVVTLKAYLEKMFVPGMNWTNHARNGWHIDHIIPLSRFDLTQEAEMMKACHYTNLQPLWAKDNLSKNNRL